MKVLVRADAGDVIGSGHVRRSLTLANALRGVGAKITFVCRAHPGHLADLIRTEGHDCRLLPVVDASGAGYAAWLGASLAQDADDTAAIAREHGHVDLLLVDHYAIGSAWQRTVRPAVRWIMAIDDLANRSHDADVVMDQNFGRTAAMYAPLVPAACRVLVGPRYALLRPEFAAARPAALERRKKFTGVRRVLVSLGGMDPQNLTERVVRLLAAARGDRTLAVTAVIGDGRQAEAIRRAAAGMDIKIIISASNMAELMRDADVAIGGMGGTAWERCALGLPTLALVLADNQRPAAARMQAAGLVIDALTPDELDEAALRRLLDLDQPTYVVMSAAVAAQCDGEGAARVAAAVQAMVREAA